MPNGAAVVLPSLFEEQIEQESGGFRAICHCRHWKLCRRAFFYLAERGELPHRPSQFLEIIRKAHEAVSIPVIASLNGVTGAGWTDHARLAQDAGASAIEAQRIFHPG